MSEKLRGISPKSIGLTKLKKKLKEYDLEVEFGMTRLSPDIKKHQKKGRPSKPKSKKKAYT